MIKDNSWFLLEKKASFLSGNFFPNCLTLFIFHFLTEHTFLLALPRNRQVSMMCLQLRESTPVSTKNVGEKSRYYPLTINKKVTRLIQSQRPEEHTPTSANWAGIDAGSVLERTSHFDQEVFFCFANWHWRNRRRTRRRRRRSSVWRRCLHRVTQNVLLCKIALSVFVASINLVFFWTSQGRSGESNSCQHCQWTGGWIVPSGPLQGGFSRAFGLNAAVTEPCQKRGGKKWF